MWSSECQKRVPMSVNKGMIQNAKPPSPPMSGPTELKLGHLCLDTSTPRASGPNALNTSGQGKCCPADWLPRINAHTLTSKIPQTVMLTTYLRRLSDMFCFLELPTLHGMEYTLSYGINQLGISKDGPLIWDDRIINWCDVTYNTTCFLLVCRCTLDMVHIKLVHVHIYSLL